MTTPNDNNEVQVVLASATEVIPTTYYFLAGASTDGGMLTIKRTDQAATPVITTLTEGTHYTVTLPASVGATGSVTAIGATVGDTWTISRCPDMTQLVSYVQNAAFPAKVTEKALDRLLMQIIKMYSALFGTNKRFLHYPDTEFLTPTVLPPKADRVAAGLGTIFGFKSTDGSPEPIAKGTLGSTLTLSNAVDLGRPSSSTSNGVTQAAANTNFENTWTGIGGLSGAGAYVVKTLSNFINSNSDLNEDITDLDATVKCVHNAAVDLNTRTTALEASPASAGSASLGVFSNRILGGTSPYNLDVTTSINLADCNVIRINFYFNYSGGVANKGAHNGAGYLVFVKVSNQWESTGSFTQYSGNTSRAPAIATKISGLTSTAMTEADSIGQSASFTGIISDGNVRITTSQVSSITSTNLTAVVEVS